MLVKVLSSLSVGFLFGVLTHSLVSPQNSFSFLSFVFFLSAVIFGVFLYKKKIFIVFIFFLIGGGFGILRYDASLQPYESRILDIFSENQTAVVIHGKIISDPVVTPSFSEFIIEADYLIIADHTLPLQTRILVKANIYFDYEYGQSVIVRGILRKPTAFETDTRRIFDYASYLGKDDIYYTMSYVDAEIIDQGTKSIIRFLYTTKHTFLKSIYLFIPQPEAGLLAGVLFGQEGALTKEYDKKFRIVGLTHIVVLSGYNVSVVILVFMRLFAFLPRLPRASLAVVSIAFFALLVGAGSTVIRASIMAVFIVFAELLHRRYHIERALFIAGIGMIFWNPKILFFDISFQLSFLATYGLIVLSPWLEKKLSFLPKLLLMRESAVATIAAQIMVLPLLLYTIGEFSIISPLVNVLVLFAVPLSMGVGFVTAVIGLIIPIMVPPFAFISTGLLSYQLIIVDLFSKGSFASLSFPPFHWSIMIIMYIFIFFWVRKISQL